MLKDITLGQYFPGNTLAHRLDPRTKLMMVVIYIIALFCAKSFLSYGILALFLLVSVKISKVGFRALIRGMKPLIFILIFTAVLNMFYTPGQAIGTFWIFTLTVEGIWAAVFMAVSYTHLDVYKRQNLGCCYERGTGMEQDFSAAVQWYRRSAEAGYDEAMANLGYCYEAGRGVEQSWPEAIQWYEKAAEAGNGRAMGNLAWCYDLSLIHI